MKVLLPLAIGGVLVACGDGSSSRVRDAAVNPDSTANPDATGVPNPVTVTLTNGGAIGSGATVYFQNADSSLVAELTTDATGTASAVMVAGGFVTALVPNLRSNPAVAGFQDVTLQTIAGVKPGDHLVIRTNVDTPARGVDFVAPFAAAGASDDYTLFSTCDPSAGSGDAGSMLDPGAGEAEATVFTESSCTVADIAVFAQGSGGGTDPVVGYAAGVAITDSVNLKTALSAYATPASVAVSLSDIPSAVARIASSRALMTPHGLLASPGVTLSPTAGAAGGNLAVAVTTGAAPTVAVTLTSPSFGGAVYGQQQVLEAGAPGTTYALDVGATLVHQYASAPAYTVATHAVTWTEGNAGQTEDFHVVSINVDRDPHSWLWVMAAAHTSTTLAYPTLPTDLFDYNPGATDSVSVEQLDALKVPGGYDSIRANVFSNIDPTTVLGAAGKVTHESLPNSSVGSAHKRRAWPGLLAPAGHRRQIARAR